MNMIAFSNEKEIKFKQEIIKIKEDLYKSRSVDAYIKRICEKLADKCRFPNAKRDFKEYHSFLYNYFKSQKIYD